MIDKRVLPHYEKLINSALNASADELCELHLNQAMGMAEYGYLINDLTHAEFNRECQRFQQVRMTRQGRAVAA